MALHLVTGYAGTEHITSADQGAYNMATFAEGEFVFDRGNKFAATVVSNNVVSIADGEAMMQGRFIKMIAGTSEDVTIENGTQGMNRNDLICIRYEKNTSTGVETASFVVKKGTETSSTPTDPEYTTGDITDGQDLVNEMPMYRVVLNGLNIASIAELFVIKAAFADKPVELIFEQVNATTITTSLVLSYNPQYFSFSIGDWEFIKRKYKLLQFVLMRCDSSGKYFRDNYDSLKKEWIVFPDIIGDISSIYYINDEFLESFSGGYSTRIGNDLDLISPKVKGYYTFRCFITSRGTVECWTQLLPFMRNRAGTVETTSANTVLVSNSLTVQNTYYHKLSVYGMPR